MEDHERAVIDEVMRIVNENDTAAVARVVHPEIQFSSIFTPMEGVYRGLDGARAYLEDLRTSFERYELAAVSAERVGDKHVVELRALASGRGSGARADMTAGQVWIFRDGLAWRVTTYPTLAEARAAAGGDT